MSACEKYVTDDVIVIGREKTFSRSARQTDKHCAPRETIPCLLLNQFLAFQIRFLQIILIALHTIPQPPFFYTRILTALCLKNDTNRVCPYSREISSCFQRTFPRRCLPRTTIIHLAVATITRLPPLYLVCYQSLLYRHALQEFV